MLFLSLRDLAQVTAAVPASSSPLGLMKHGSLDRTTPEFISDPMPTLHIHSSAYFLFYYNPGFTTAHNSHGFNEEDISEQQGGHGPQVCTWCLKKMRHTMRVMKIFTSLIAYQYHNFEGLRCRSFEICTHFSKHRRQKYIQQFWILIPWPFHSPSVNGLLDKEGS